MKFSCWIIFKWNNQNISLSISYVFFFSMIFFVFFRLTAVRTSIEYRSQLKEFQLIKGCWFTHCYLQSCDLWDKKIGNWILNIAVSKRVASSLVNSTKIRHHKFDFPSRWPNGELRIHHENFSDSLWLWFTKCAVSRGGRVKCDIKR